MSGTEWLCGVQLGGVKLPAGFPAARNSKSMVHAGTGRWRQKNGRPMLIVGSRPAVYRMAVLTSSNERISGEVNALKMSPAFAQSANRSSRAVSRDIPRRLRMFRGINADGRCWYHQVWGTSARKCADGCRNAGNDRTGNDRAGR